MTFGCSRRDERSVILSGAMTWGISIYDKPAAAVTVWKLIESIKTREPNRRAFLLSLSEMRPS